MTRTGGQVDRAAPAARPQPGVPRCPACGGPGTSRRYEVESYDLFRCSLCHTEFLVQNPSRPPNDKTYWDAYKFELYGDEAVQREYEQRYSLLLDSVRTATEVRTVLDIGCGIGNFVEWAGRQGLEATGADVDADAVATARERGLDAHLASELGGSLTPGSVDLVTLWDVIEHVENPRALLSDSLRWLRPGGCVILETPDVAFPARQAALRIRKVLEPVRWSDMFYYVGHLVYFSDRGLSTLMGACGLDVVGQFGLRSPSAKMAHIVAQWASLGAGAGRMGPALYRGLDGFMRGTGITNKLVMVGRLPE